MTPVTTTGRWRVPWIEALPDGWQFLSAKRLFQPRPELASVDEPQLAATQAYGVIEQAEYERRVGRKVTKLNKNLDKRRLVKRDDFIISMRSFEGGLERAWAEGGIRSSYIVLKPAAEISVGYYQRLFKSQPYIQALRATGNFIRDGQDLNYSNFSLVDLPYPPPEDQALIARYLDWHGAMTGRLIRAKRRLIALLNEQKQSIIHRAVTRGLDPAATLKPSGNPLIGEIVDGWDIKRLRNVAELRVSNVDKKVHEGEMPVRLCNYVDVYRNEEIGAGIPFMEATATSFESERFRLKIGDVIITKDSEDWKDIGVPALVATEADDLVCAYHLAMLRPFPDEIEGAFLFWQLIGWAARWSFAMQASGVTRFGLSQGAIKGLQLVVPPLEDQRRIVAHLVEATAEIRRGVQDALDEIALIQEFRTRLIADVVTGQLDVRSVAANLPEIYEADPADLTADDDLDDDAEDLIDEEEAA